MLHVTLRQVSAGCGCNPNCQACRHNAYLLMLLSCFCLAAWCVGNSCCSMLHMVAVCCLGLTPISVCSMLRPGLL